MSLLIFGQHSIVFYLLMKSWFLLSILPNTFLITRTLRYTHQKTKHKLHIQGFRSDPGGGAFLFCRGYIHTLHSVPLGVIQLLINLWFEVTFFDMMGLGEIILKNLKSEINLSFWITLKFLFFLVLTSGRKIWIYFFQHYHSHLNPILEELVGNQPTVTDMAYLRTRLGDDCKVSFQLFNIISMFKNFIFKREKRSC